MTISSRNRLAVEGLIKLHGHIVDQGAWHRLHEVFDPAVAMDITAFGGGKLRGLDAIRDAAIALGEDNPIAHHVTNIVLRRDGTQLVGISKGFGVRSDGTVGSVEYEDRIGKTAYGWRIMSRTVTPRILPLRKSAERPISRC
jgi:hypothetical protein